MTNEVAVRVENRLFDFTNKSIAEAMELAKVLCDSSFVPTAYKGKPGDALVAIGYGQEVGLSPISSLQSVAVINGKPSVYGDALPGIIQTHPKYEYHTLTYEGEGDSLTAVCGMKRAGSPLHIVKFSVADAKKANLWGKAGPWTQYPKRMLGWRALGFAARDMFADKLRGLVLAEEAQDYPKTAEVIPMPKAVEVPAAVVESVAEAPVVEASVKTISGPQRKRLFALLDESGKTQEDLKAHLLTLGITSTKEIPVENYEQVVNFCSTKKEG